MSWDPYTTLGVKRAASADEIKSAYRKLAKELHPDVRPGDKAAEDRFKRATAAFNLLSDPAMKARFDRGEIDADGNERTVYSSRPRARTHAGAAGPEAAFDLGDIFSDFFSSGPQGARGFGRMRGRDLRYALDIDFMDAVRGARRRIQLDEGRTLEVQIPPGVESGRTLRLKAQGGPGVGGGPPGDALVEVTVRPHHFFRREGQDIHMDLPVSLTEAVEGAKVQAPTVFGPVSITVPPGANTGMLLRLKGKGVGGTGDQLVRLMVMLPETPDDELKKFVRKWSRREQAPPRPLTG